LQPKWFKNHVAYSIAKYGMSLCVLGMAEDSARMGSPSMLSGPHGHCHRRHSNVLAANSSP